MPPNKDIRNDILTNLLLDTSSPITSPTERSFLTHLNKQPLATVIFNYGTTLTLFGYSVFLDWYFNNDHVRSVS